MTTQTTQQTIAINVADMENFVSKLVSNSDFNRSTKVRKPHFRGSNITQVVVDHVLGAQGRKIFEDKFKHLGKELYLNDRSTHPHGVGATARSLFNQAIVEGRASTGNILDIGGHMLRTATHHMPNGNCWTSRVHSCCPILDGHDEYRHTTWKQNLQQRGFSYPIPNSCDRVCGEIPSFFDKGCITCKGHFTTVMSVDSWYYPGVIDELRARAKNHGSAAYIVGNDYDFCRRNGFLTARAADEESTMRLCGSFVESRVKGNPFPYRHGYLKTGSGSWQYTDAEGALVITVEDTIMNGDIPYHLMRAVYVEKPVSGLTTYSWDDRWARVPEDPEFLDFEPIEAPRVNRLRTIADKVKANALTIVSNVRNTLTAGETVSVLSDGKVQLTASTSKWGLLGNSTKTKTYTARPEWIIPEVPKFMGRVTPLEIIRLSRTAFQDKLKDTGSLDDAEEMSSAVIIALHYACVSSGTIVSHANESAVVQNFKDSMAGAVENFSRKVDWAFVAQALLATCLVFGVYYCTAPTGVQSMPIVSFTGESWASNILWFLATVGGIFKVFIPVIRALISSDDRRKH